MRHVARPLRLPRAKRGKKACPAKKEPETHSTRRKPPAPKKPKESREGSKASAILELLKRPGGATAKELMKATGWQPHSVRGFLSGTLRKKRGLEVISAKSADGERTYCVRA